MGRQRLMERFECAELRVAFARVRFFLGTSALTLSSGGLAIVVALLVAVFRLDSVFIVAIHLPASDGVNVANEKGAVSVRGMRLSCVVTRESVVSSVATESDALSASLGTVKGVAVVMNSIGETFVLGTEGLWLGLYASPGEV
eukprot:519750-Pleurochrysis_carterae.AAC.1